MAEELLEKGKAMLAAVALRYAGDHGLHPEVAWEHHGFEWLLRLSDASHTVRLVFSPDEIALFAEADPANRETKLKIRNAFAGLSM